MIAETYTKISADKKPALRGLSHTVFLSRFFRLCILTNRNHHQLNSRRRHTRNTAGLRQCFRTYILQFQRDFTRQTRHDVIIEVAWNTGFLETRIPGDFDYDIVSGLSREITLKLKDVRPETLAQASRIPGVTPAAVQLVMITIRKNAQTKKSA